MPRPDMPFNWIVDIIHRNEPYTVFVESSINLGEKAVKKEARSQLKQQLLKEYVKRKITKIEIR